MPLDEKNSKYFSCVVQLRDGRLLAGLRGSEKLHELRLEGLGAADTPRLAGPVPIRQHRLAHNFRSMSLVEIGPRGDNPELLAVLAGDSLGLFQLRYDSDSLQLTQLATIADKSFRYPILWLPSRQVILVDGTKISVCHPTYLTIFKYFWVYLTEALMGTGRECRVMPPLHPICMQATTWGPLES